MWTKLKQLRGHTWVLWSYVHGFIVGQTNKRCSVVVIDILRNPTSQHKELFIKVTIKTGWLVPFYMYLQACDSPTRVHHTQVQQEPGMSITS